MWHPWYILQRLVKVNHGSNFDLSFADEVMSSVTSSENNVTPDADYEVTDNYPFKRPFAITEVLSTGKGLKNNISLTGSHMNIKSMLEDLY